jgi:hypothetical protein
LEEQKRLEEQQKHLVEQRRLNEQPEKTHCREAITNQNNVELLQHDSSDTETEISVTTNDTTMVQDFVLWAGQLGCSPHSSSFLRLEKIQEMLEIGVEVSGAFQEYKCCNPTCGKSFIPTYCCRKVPEKTHCVMFCNDCVETAQTRLCSKHYDVSGPSIYGDPKKYMDVYTDGNHMFGNSKWGRGRSCNGCKTVEYRKTCKSSNNAFFYCKTCRDDYVNWQQNLEEDDNNAPYVCLFCVDCKDHSILLSLVGSENANISGSSRRSVRR